MYLTDITSCVESYHVEGAAMVVLLQKLVLALLVALVGDDSWVLLGVLASLVFRHVAHLLGVRLLLLSSARHNRLF